MILNKKLIENSALRSTTKKVFIGSNVKIIEMRTEYIQFFLN